MNFFMKMLKNPYFEINLKDNKNLISVKYTVFPKCFEFGGEYLKKYK